MKFEWELIGKVENDQSVSGTRRAKVHGGWIVHTILQIYTLIRDSTVFIPDPNHEWTIDK